MTDREEHDAPTLLDHHGRPIKKQPAVGPNRFDALKKHPAALVLGLFVAIFAGVSTVIGGVDSLGQLFIHETTVYDVELEIQPVHILYGAIDRRKYIVSDPASPLSADSIPDWIAGNISREASRRDFGSTTEQAYVLRIEGSRLVLDATSTGKSAFIYAIQADETSYGLESIFRGIRDGRPPMLNQLARELHEISSVESKVIDLDRYFTADREDAYVNAESFVLNDCKCVLFTFHGSNGQFKGSLFSIFKQTERGAIRLQFADGSVTKRVSTTPRQARVLFVGSKGQAGGSFIAKAQRKLEDTHNVLNAPHVRSKEELEVQIERARAMPLSDARERFIDAHAVDFVVDFAAVERSSRRILGWWQV